jgi:hypothetical protein
MATQPTPDSILVRLFPDEDIVLPETDGTRTIARADDVFRRFIDRDFEDWGTDKPGRPTAETRVAVHEMRQNATFARMFGSLADDPRKLVFTQHQIIGFCERHPDKLPQSGCATFFLFEENDYIFVARVNVHPDGLRMRLDPFDFDYAWDPDFRYRVVVPQLST